MPRGVYPRKSKRAAGAGVNGASGILEQLRAERTRLEDRIVAIGTAIDALEALEDPKPGPRSRARAPA